MITYDLSKCGRTPKYTYLYQCIRDDILSGRLRAGQRLPAKRALAQHLNVAIITVANAYEQLATEGYIAAEERRGYFIQELSQEFAQIPPSIGAAPHFHLPEPKLRTYFADFCVNQSNIRLFPSSTWNQLMRQCLYQKPEELFRPMPYNGLYELRVAIADYLQRNRGMLVSPSQIVVEAGTESLYNRITQLFGHVCTFGFENPGYKKLSVICGAYGNPCCFIPIDKEGLRVDQLEESGTDVVHVSPSHHYPTGLVMPITRRLELLEWASRAQKRYIIEDDYDSEFRYRGQFIAPLYTEDTQDKVIYVNTFSKTMVSTLRISYMVLPPRLVERYRKVMGSYSCSASKLEQAALARFISEGYFERHISHLKNYYRKIRLQILKEIEQSPLSNISKIIEFYSGTHFLLRVHTSLSEETIRQAGSDADLHLLMYSRYSDARIPPDECILIINYAALDPDRVKEAIHRLAQLFPECRSSK